MQAFDLSSILGVPPVIQNNLLFDVWVSSAKNERLQKVLVKIKCLLKLEDCSEHLEESLVKQAKYFCMNVDRMWNECKRARFLFQKKHARWLDGSFTLPTEMHNVRQSIVIESEPGPSRGRPRKPFEEVSRKTKIRRVETIVSQYSTDELNFAAERSAKLSDSVPAGAENSVGKTLTPQQALALYYDLSLSVRKYNILRSVINALHKDCFPSYRQILQTKNNYLPSNIAVSDISAEVDLQSLLNKTVNSILNISDLKMFHSRSNLKLICKWGFDGSSGHSLYKQTFEDNNHTDEFMFFIAFVPLKLVDPVTKRIIWSNPRPSSTMYCRPIKFIFIKETADVIRTEESKMVEKISDLKDYETCNADGKYVNISFDMLFTMFDGSVANILSGTNATAKCIVCGATPKEMNLEKVLNKKPNSQNYRFGLSTLHCWIRFFECLLHISYRLQLKTWQVRGEENKIIFENTKKRIQTDFRSKMGLIVDKPKPGYGSTNDGNTARVFFKNATLSAEITGLDKGIIIKFSLILRTLASGCKINVGKFKELLNETRKIYLNLYEWYFMPSTIHKVLVHGCDILDFFELPIGQLSEDALEARHKEFRKIRLYHSRKFSRIDTNTDIIRTLLLTSDPELSHHRHRCAYSKKNVTGWDTQVQEYLFIEEPQDSSFLENLPQEVFLSEDESDHD